MTTALPERKPRLSHIILTYQLAKAVIDLVQPPTVLEHHACSGMHSSSCLRESHDHSKRCFRSTYSFGEHEAVERQP